MKKLFLICFVLLITVNLSAQWQYEQLSPSADKRIKASIEELRTTGRLPIIRGTWYYVDPSKSANTASGKTQAKAFKEIESAYEACTSGAGDGIVIFSYGTSTSATTQYLSTPLTWSKHGITVLGVASPVGMYSRARIADTTGVDSLDFMINVSGDNNTFINLHFYNSVDTNEVQHAAIKVTGNRNSFINNHFAAVPTTMAATKCDIILDSAEENYFYHCTFGTDTKDMGNNAACHIYFDDGCIRNFFEDCYTVAYVSTGTAFGCVKSADATSVSGSNYFKDCTFAAWQANGAAPSLASWFIGTKPNTGLFILKDCFGVGYAAWDAVGGNDRVYTNQPASNAAGGISVTP